MFKAFDETNPKSVFAVKCIKKKKINKNKYLLKLLYTEVGIMGIINHQNVIHL